VRRHNREHHYQRDDKTPPQVPRSHPFATLAVPLGPKIAVARPLAFKRF